MSFPGSPRILKGAVVGIVPPDPLPRVVIFQYNPGSIARHLRPSRGPAGGRFDPQRLTGAPREELNVEIRIDATDQLARGKQEALEFGIYPQLSALEIFAYPPSAEVIADALLMGAGFIEIAPPAAPLVLFIWGEKRILPVLIQGYEIREELYDTRLNPLQATVNMKMQVLSYSDLRASNPGYHLYLSNQIMKETMADLVTVNSLRKVI